MTFTASMATAPEKMSLKARLAWEYFFGAACGGWACVRTADGAIVVTDESCNLDTASIYPDDDSFISWLEAVAEDHIGDDRVEWFRQFITVKELIDDEVARAMERLL